MFVALSIQFRPVTCYRSDCGLTFALPVEHDDALRRSREEFFCPRGHRQSYMGESYTEKVARLERERNEARERRVQDIEQAESRIALLERRRRATAGHLTRAKRRAAHGICPCCSRTFTNLARHVAGQHPEFVAAAKGSGDE